MDADGLTNVSYTYQWIRVDGTTETDIAGETASTFTLVAADLGKRIKVTVSFIDDDSLDLYSALETLTSAPTAVVSAAAGGGTNLLLDFGTASDSYPIKVFESRDTQHRFVLSLRTRPDAAPDGNPQQPVTIPLLVTHVGGATTEDYEGLPASVTFGVGESEADFDLRAIPDQTKEIGEGLRLDFGALPPGVTKGTWGPYEIIEFLDEIRPWVTASFGAEAYTATEGGGAAGVSIHLSEPVDLEPLEVGLLLEYGGGATAADHGSIPEVVTFAVGEQTKTITVTATDDTDDDDGESVSLSFVNDPNDRVTTGGAATLALVDNDGPAQVMVSFGAATYTATEGGAAATVRVELDAAPGRAVTVPLPPVHVGGATAADYSGLPASVTFGANQTAQTFTVTATPDTDSDGGESVSIGFGALPPGVFAGHPASAAVTLADGSEQTLVVDFGTASNSNVIKVREGLVIHRFTLILDSAPQLPVTIPLVVTHVGGATAADYTELPASVTFGGGESVVGFDLRAIPDETKEIGEGLRLDFGTLPPGVTKGTWGPYETLEFVDVGAEQVMVSFGAATYTATEGGAAATVRVELDAAAGRPVTVPRATAFTTGTGTYTLSSVVIPLTTADVGGATAADYSGIPETVTFAANQTAVTFTVTATADTDADGGDSVSIGFGTLPPGVFAGSPATTVTLADDSGPGPTPMTMTARFTQTPSAHDGSNGFELHMEFSHEPENFSYRTVQGALFDIEGGRIERVWRRERGKDRQWGMVVAPGGGGAVTLVARATSVCAAPHAVCDAGGRKFAGGLTVTIPGPEPSGQAQVADPITASWSRKPDEHDGASQFDLHLDFSRAPVNNFSYHAIEGGVVSVQGGRISRVWQRVRGQNDQWGVEVTPSGTDGVTVSVNGTTDCAAQHAVCAADGGMLEDGAQAVISGPAALSVANARVEEERGATLDFVVSLSRSRSRNEATAVEYATSDDTARAGEDYTATAGTLTFAVNETSRTVSVTVLDDAHDEGEETLTLRLSNPSGARVADDEATGTIENTDPLPRALLARFGRTAAVHVVEHVEERLEATREPGFRGRFAGRELRRGMERDFALNFVSQLGGMAGVSPLGGGGAGSPVAGVGGMGSIGTPGFAGAMTGTMGATGLGSSGVGAVASPMGAAAGPAGGFFNGGGLLQMGLGGGDLLTGSDFALNRESRGGILSFWSRGARSHFAGREGTLGLNGNVNTTMFGADYARGPIVAGLSLSHSRGLGEYAGVASGQVLSSVTGLYPWLGYQATDRITVWGVGGYGGGGLLLTPQGGPALESGLSMKMAAAGTRGELVTGVASGFALAFKADALWVGTSIGGADGPAGRLAATDAAVTRFRTGLEGSQAYTVAGRLSLTPSVEVGLRHDGGNAETGAGMDVGAGLVVSDSSTGLSLDVRVRTLLVHQAEGFRERGVALSLSYNPTPSMPLGFTARVAPSWGGEARSGAEALWNRETMAGTAHGSFAQGNRLDGEVGYGLPVGSRFVGTPRVGFSASEYGRDYRVGYRLGVLDQGNANFELGVDAQRRENAMQGRARNGFLGRVTLRW